MSCKQRKSTNSEKTYQMPAPGRSTARDELECRWAVRSRAKIQRKLGEISLRWNVIRRQNRSAIFLFTLCTVIEWIVASIIRSLAFDARISLIFRWMKNGRWSSHLHCTEWTSRNWEFARERLGSRCRERATFEIFPKEITADLNTIFQLCEVDVSWRLLTFHSSTSIAFALNELVDVFE